MSKHANKESGSAVDQEAKAVFARLDKNSDGCVDFNELKRGLKSLGIPVTTEKDVKRLFESIDVNRDGFISQEEFRQFVNKQVQELRQVFNSFDKNKDGTIDASELLETLKQLGLDYDDAEVQKLMAHFKSVKGGRIPFGDWVRSLLLVPAVNRVAKGLMMLYFPWQANSRLQELQPDYTAGLLQKRAQEAIEQLQDELNKMQEHLYVSGKHAVLLVLQGLDTSGKDGAVKSLTVGLNASGVRIESFKSPTELERAHDYLWRVHQVVPQKGQVTIFNRSHYEDVLVVKLLKLASDEAIEKRYQQIINFEDHLLENGTIIIKAVLHISKGEQRNRLFRRQAEHPWKLSSSDWPTHDRFDEYMDIYNTALKRTSTKSNPWFIIPVDNKWFRDLALLRLVVDRLRPYHEVWKKDIGEKARTLPPFARPFPDSWAKAPTKAKL